jgi:hypothetical protein
MRWWSEMKYLVRKLDRRRAEQELEEETRAHLEMETWEKINDGLSSHIFLSNRAAINKDGLHPFRLHSVRKAIIGSIFVARRAGR